MVAVVNPSRRELHVLLLLHHVRDALHPLRGRPWSPELAGEIVRRATERILQVFPTPASDEPAIRRILAEIVHDAVREQRSKGEM